MNCPDCRSHKLRVYKVHRLNETQRVRRYSRCPACGAKFCAEEKLVRPGNDAGQKRKPNLFIPAFV